MKTKAKNSAVLFYITMTVWTRASAAFLSTQITDKRKLTLKHAAGLQTRKSHT